jgi:hypothetical protein
MTSASISAASTRLSASRYHPAGKPPRPGDFPGRVVHSRAKDADAAIEKASTLLKIDPERLMAVRIAEKD